MTKARLIQQYVNVVETDRVPPPFNVAQWLFTLPFLVLDYCFSPRGADDSSFPDAPSSLLPSNPGQRSSKAGKRRRKPRSLFKESKGFFGRVVFWAMLGPAAVVGGWVLWAMSIIKAPRVVWSTSTDKTLCGRFARMVLAVVACAVGAPFWLLVMWARGGLVGVKKTIRRIGDICQSFCSGKDGRRDESSRALGRGVSRAGAGRGGGGAETVAASRVFPGTRGGTGAGAGGGAAAVAAAGDASEKVVKVVLQEADGGEC